MERLVVQAEAQPEHRQRCLAQAVTLCQQHPHLADLAELRDRLIDGGTWREVSAVNFADQGAGVRLLQPPDQPAETPALRVRRALLRPLRRGEYWLSNQRDLVGTFAVNAAEEWELSLQEAVVPYLPATPLTVVYEQDGQASQSVPLPPDGSSRKLQVPIPPRPTSFRLRIEKPIANHFVIARVAEQDANRDRMGDHPFLIKEDKWKYYVATPREPIRLVVESPTWLRIDQRRDETTYSWYLAVPAVPQTVDLTPQAITAGSQSIALPPPPGREEALFRVYQYVFEPLVSPPAVHWVERVPAGVPAPLLDPLSPPPTALAREGEPALEAERGARATCSSPGGRRGKPSPAWPRSISATVSPCACRMTAQTRWGSPTSTAGRWMRGSAWGCPTNSCNSPRRTAISIPGAASTGGPIC